MKENPLMTGLREAEAELMKAAKVTWLTRHLERAARLSKAAIMYADAVEAATGE